MRDDVRSLDPERSADDHADDTAEARRAAWSYTPSPRTSRDTAGGFVGGLILELALGLGVHLFWPVLVRWMSFRRAAGYGASGSCSRAPS